tara:strand:- start:36 stop:1169 length:1134 start_codon:yes stop_codon:yes gene_type:complete
MVTAGIYIHVPFCATKCMYCDFYSVADREESIDRYINALKQEIKQCSVDVSNWRFDTIFIGGGTPSLLKGSQVGSIISALEKKYNLSHIIEFTLEANPGEAPKENLRDFLSLGINRLSIGVQSLHKEILKFLTRIHDRDDVLKTYQNAREIGFQNINFDLIYSIPGQTWEMWEEDLNQIYDLDPEHISAYSLTVEKGTELFKMVKNKTISISNNDDNAFWFENTHHKMKFNGYSPYEISNFSKPGNQCKHNLHYWETHPYLAFGASANGFDKIHRWKNIHSLDKYINAVEQKKSPISFTERLSNIDQINEFIGFGLRMIKGFNINRIPKTLEDQFNNNFFITKSKYKNCFRTSDNNISLSKNGLLLADEIIPDLLLE